ncbi:MAG: hypothetical protein NT029_10295, partial [Armatimonadetes bacterium]|nr:hypothetical protein [Armatimonadota bacterium]
MCHHSSAAPPPRPDALRRFSRLAAPAALLLSLGTASAAPGGAKPAMRAPNTPLTFERNTGHWPKEVQFVARSGQGTLFLTRREAVVSLKSGEKRTALRLTLAGAVKGDAVAVVLAVTTEIRAVFQE